MFSMHEDADREEEWEGPEDQPWAGIPNPAPMVVLKAPDFHSRDDQPLK